MNEPRKVDDLQAAAVGFWPHAIAASEAKSSIIPRLIETQEKFIGILYVSDSSPRAWKEVLTQTSGLPGNLFLKHLMVLADLGGEPLNRLKPALRKAFSNDTMRFRWNSKTWKYKFESLSTPLPWTNSSLRVDGRGLSQSIEINAPLLDVAMLLLHGGGATSVELPALVTEKCVIGAMIGRKEELNRFVRERYIWVSRITGGATANALGQLGQTLVRDRLQELLSEWDLSAHTIPGISQNLGRTDMSFDIVARSPRGRFCAVEVSFQVTTNSTIERKAGQAMDRERVLHQNGHHIAYVIDGAGNFERRSALATICAHSDCTVTFREDELARLADYLDQLDQ